MVPENFLTDTNLFSEMLFSKMKQLSPGIGELELYEFCYCLENLTPRDGWGTITLEPMEVLETKVNQRGYYENIKLTPKVDGLIVLDEEIAELTRMLFVGLVCSEYSIEWIAKLFYFDVRGFYFLHRTNYFTDQVLAYFNGNPYRMFDQKQKAFDKSQEVGYRAFKEANREVDRCFFECVEKLVDPYGTPVIIGIAGPTAAGKTEIVSRLVDYFKTLGHTVTSIEMDNFLLDRDYREERGIDSLGREALHLELFLNCLHDICAGKEIITPRYNFISAESSHNLHGKLKPGYEIVTVEPGDIIFIEGNFPFLLPEVSQLTGIKVVYLTDDDVRLKRKWRRDMDLRKKYDLNYFRNRYFREQYLMADTAYIPQMQTCDLIVDTTGARLWVRPDKITLLEKS